MSQITHENSVAVHQLHGHSGSGANLKSSHVSVGPTFKEPSFIQPASTVASSLTNQQQIEFYLEGQSSNGFVTKLALELMVISSTGTEIAHANQWVRRVVIQNKKGETISDTNSIQNWFATYLNPEKELEVLLHDGVSNGTSTTFGGVALSTSNTFHIQLYSLFQQAQCKIPESERVRVIVYLQAVNFSFGGSATVSLSAARLIIFRDALRSVAEDVHRSLSRQRKTYRVLVPMDGFNEQKALAASTTYSMKLSGLSGQSVAFICLVAMASDTSTQGAMASYTQIVDDTLELRDSAGQVVGTTYTHATNKNILHELLGGKKVSLLAQKANIYTIPHGTLSAFDGIMSGERTYNGNENIVFKTPAGLASATYTMNAIGFCYRMLASDQNNFNLL